jgi:hypothetical protein
VDLFFDPTPTYDVVWYCGNTIYSTAWAQAIVP